MDTEATQGLIDLVEASLKAQVNIPPKEEERTFHFQINKEVLGPYRAQDIKLFLQENKKFPYQVKVKNLKEHSWIHIYDHPFFDRRLQANPDLPGSTGQFQVFIALINGQKAGPFTVEELGDRVKNHDLLLTDQVSYDFGKSWTRICQLPQFDRRNRKDQKDEALPYMPEDKTFIRSSEEVLKKLNQNVQQEDEAIIGLALIGQKQEEQTPVSHEVETIKGPKIFASLGVGCFLIAALIGIYSFRQELVSQVQHWTKEDLTDFKKIIPVERRPSSTPRPVAKKVRKTPSPKAAPKPAPPAATIQKEEILGRNNNRPAPENIAEEENEDDYDRTDDDFAAEEASEAKTSQEKRSLPDELLDDEEGEISDLEDDYDALDGPASEEEVFEDSEYY